MKRIIMVIAVCASAYANVVVSNVTAFAPTTNSINLSWTCTGIEQMFYIYRHTSNDTNAASVVGTMGSNTNMYTSTGLLASTTYYYWLRSSNMNGISWFSTVASATTLSNSNTAPAAPANIYVFLTNTNELGVGWLSSAGATGYKLYRSNSGQPITNIMNLAVTGYTNTGLLSSTLYYYYVQATNSYGVSQYSVATSAITLTNSNAAPLAPSFVSVAYTNTNYCVITWTASSGATGYSLYRSNSGQSQTMVGSIGGTWCTNSSLLSDTVYYYWVSATNIYGSSALSMMATVTTLSNSNITVLPPAPTGVSASSASTTSALVSWSDVSNDAGYVVYRNTVDDSNTSVYGTSAAMNATSGTCIGLVGGGTYYFWVRASNAAGLSPYSASAMAVIELASNAPAMPASFTASASTTSVRLIWSDTADELGYRIYRSTASNTIPTSPIATLAANTVQYDDYSLSNATTYHYWIEATNAIGASPKRYTFSTTLIGGSSNVVTRVDTPFVRVSQGEKPTIRVVVQETGRMLVQVRIYDFTSGKHVLTVPEHEVNAAEFRFTWDKVGKVKNGVYLVEVMMKRPGEQYRVVSRERVVVIK